MTFVAAAALMGVYAWVQDSIPARQPIDFYGVTGALFFFMLRDIGLYFYFHFSDKPSRALASTIVTYLVLYLLVPSIFNGLDFDSILPVFWPMGDVHTLHAVLPALLQAGFMCWLTAKRWKKHFWTATAS